MGCWYRWAAYWGIIENHRRNHPWTWSFLTDGRRQMGGPQDCGQCWELRWFCDKICIFLGWCFLPWLWTVACWFMLLWLLGGCVWSSLWHYRHGIIREQQLTCSMLVSRIGPNKSSSNMCLSWKLMLFLIFPLGLSPQKTGDFWNQDELLHPQPSPSLSTSLRSPKKWSASETWSSQRRKA